MDRCFRSEVQMSKLSIVMVLCLVFTIACREMPAESKPKTEEQERAIAQELLQAQPGDLLIVRGKPVPIHGVSKYNDMFFFTDYAFKGRNQATLSWVARDSDEVVLRTSEGERWKEVAAMYLEGQRPYRW